mgnify:CR=1 FL=1
MKIFKESSLVSVLCLLAFALSSFNAHSYGGSAQSSELDSTETKFATSEELLRKYPSISEVSNRSENKEILCPFWRLIERSGALDAAAKVRESGILISLKHIISKAFEFGCDKISCGTVATLVSAGQLTHLGTTKIGSVNISKLHKARGIAHDCGLTFEKGGTVISDLRRAQTLARLKEIADSSDIQGQLNLSDLMMVKEEICSAEKVSMSTAGKL